MKAKKVIFCALSISLLSIQSMTPSDLLSKTSSIKGRMPASLAKKAKKIISEKELNDLKETLSKLEQDLKNKESLLDQKSKDVDHLKNTIVDDKIVTLNQMIADQKADIDYLKAEIKNSAEESKVVVNETHTSIEVVLCKSEAKGEKLQADMKKLLEDKEVVLQQVDGLKKENEGLKLKLTSSLELPKVSQDIKQEAKPEAKQEVKKEEIAKEETKNVAEKPVEKKQQSHEKNFDNSEVIALMSQMTTMFTAQMQSQMALQVQMLNMLSQMQSNFLPKTSAYAFDSMDSSFFSRSQYGINEGFGLGMSGYGIGLPAHYSAWNNTDYQNPYSVMPSLSRQPADTQSDYGFKFATPKPFDFSQPLIQAPTQSQSLPLIIPAQEPLSRIYSI